MRYSVQAIYLPVWRLDHIVSLKERISGDLLDLEATSLGTIIPATQTEPLASAPLSYVYDPLQSGDLEAYNPQKHLQAFKPEDLLHREDIGQKPMVIPFSSMLPDIEALWRKAANNSENENIEFTGEFKTILQSASPILMPYYLVDFQDLNPSYSNDPVSEVSCLSTSKAASSRVGFPLILGHDLPDIWKNREYSQSSVWLYYLLLKRLHEPIVLSQSSSLILLKYTPTHTMTEDGLKENLLFPKRQ